MENVYQLQRMERQQKQNNGNLYYDRKNIWKYVLRPKEMKMENVYVESL